MDLVKAVIDVEKGITAVGEGLRADEEAALIAERSLRENTWEANLYPDKSGEEFIEYNSMVNIKPAHDNRSRGVENSETRKKSQSSLKN